MTSQWNHNMSKINKVSYSKILDLGYEKGLYSYNQWRLVDFCTLCNWAEFYSEAKSGLPRGWAGT